MVRLIYCLRRWSGASPEEFRNHWLEHHVQRFGQPIQQIRRYVLYAAEERQPSINDYKTVPYDGFAAVWIDNLPTLRSVMDRAMPEAAKDEALFIDHDRSRAVLVNDQVIVEPDAPAPIVLFECLVRRSGMDYDEFSAAWLAHGERARWAHRRGLLQGYIQSHVWQDPQGGLDRFDDLGRPIERWDGIGVAYFHSIVLARRYLESSGGLPTAGASFIDSEKTVSTLARRHARRDPVR